MQAGPDYQKQFADKIINYINNLGDKTKRNLNSLASSVGVSRQCLANYTELQRKPRPDLIARVLIKIKMPHLIEEFVQGMYPENLITPIDKSSFFNKEMASLSSEQDDFFNDPNYFDLLYRCYNKTGESYSKLVEEQGNAVKEKIQILINEDLIIRNGDLLKCPTGKEDFKPEPKTVQNHIKLSTDCFKYDRCMTKSNMMFHLTEKIDRQTREKLHAYMDNAISIAWSIMNKENVTEDQKQRLINAIESDTMPVFQEESRTTFLSIVMDDYEKDVPQLEPRENLQ